MTRILALMLGLLFIRTPAQAFDFSSWKAKTIETQRDVKIQRIRLKSDSRITGMVKIRTNTSELSAAMEFYKTQKPLFQLEEQRVFEQGNGQFHIVLVRNTKPYAIVQFYGAKPFTKKELKIVKTEMKRTPFASVIREAHVSH